MSESRASEQEEQGALTFVLSSVLVRARMGGRDKSVDPDQLADLMVAVHNISGLLQDWTAYDRESIVAALDDYERKWADKGGPEVRTIPGDAGGVGG